MTKSFNILGREVGEGSPCYIIAELSCNHENDLEEALAIIRASAEAGVDAVKFQTYTADTMTLKVDVDCGDTMWGDTDLHELYDRAHTPWEWHEILKSEALKLGLGWFSSPFDETSVDFLDKLDAPIYKISSFEIVDTELVKKIAKTGKPVIFSNGMATYQEILETYNILEQEGCGDIAILHCNSGYPPPFESANLNTIPIMNELFDAVIGLSDHTLFADSDNKTNPMPHISPLEAVKLGAKIIEVHVTLDRNKSKDLFEKGQGGFDWPFSRTPEELKMTIDLIRRYEDGHDVEYQSDEEHRISDIARGSVCFTPTQVEYASREYRPVLWVSEDINKGEVLKFKGGE